MQRVAGCGGFSQLAVRACGLVHSETSVFVYISCLPKPQVRSSTSKREGIHAVEGR